MMIKEEVAYRPPFLFSTICGRSCWGLGISCIFADGGGWADCWLHIGLSIVSGTSAGE